MPDVETHAATEVMVTYAFWRNSRLLPQQGILPQDVCSYIFSCADASVGVALLMRHLR